VCIQYWVSICGKKDQATTEFNPIGALEKKMNRQDAKDAKKRKKLLLPCSDSAKSQNQNTPSPSGGKHGSVDAPAKTEIAISVGIDADWCTRTAGAGSSAES
jgi:hypothetical protein